MKLVYGVSKLMRPLLLTKTSAYCVPPNETGKGGEISAALSS
jgi:hypothetical protein